MKKYECNLKDCENLIERYIKENGEYYEIQTGILGLGEILLYDYENKLKCFVIKEYFKNEWSSGHIVKEYNNYEILPKKYKKLLTSIL